MRTIKRQCRRLLMAALPAIVALHATENESSRSLREVGESYLRAVIRDDPLRQVQLGLPIDGLPDYSFNATERRSREAAALLSRLARVRPADLTYEETLSLDLLRVTFRHGVDDPGGFYFHSQVTPYSSPIGAVARVFSAMPLATRDDRARYLARLDDMKTVGATIASNIQGQVTRGIRIPRPELVLVDRFLESFAVTGDASPFRPAAPRLQGLPSAESDAFLRSVDSKIGAVVSPAIHAVAAMLRGDYAARAPDAVGSVPATR